MSVTTNQQVQLSYDLLLRTGSGLYLSEMICVELLQPVGVSNNNSYDN